MTDEQGQAQERNWKFQKTAYTYDPQADYVPIPGLFEKVKALTTGKKFATAMKEVFRALDQHPNHNEALHLASIILNESRTEQLRAAEPVTNDQFYDPRLDPIFVECSSCRATWVPLDSVFTFGEMAVMNPIGIQCQECGYVRCRTCYEKDWDETGSEEFQPCPYCHSNNWQGRVLPTGRTPRQVMRSSAPVIAALLHREGPVQPDKEYTRRVLLAVSPDVLEDDANIVGAPLYPWPDASPEEVMQMVRDELRAGYIRGDIPTAPEDSQTVYFKDEDGARCILTKFMLSQEETEAVETPLVNIIDTAVQELADMGTPQAAETSQVLSRLKGSRTIQRMIGWISSNQEAARTSGRLRYYAFETDNLILFELTMASLNRQATRENATAPLVEFIENSVPQFGIDPSSADILALFYQFEEDETQVYMHYISHSTGRASLLGVGMPTLADLESGANGACMFWFHWPTISDGGYPSYGRYVYTQALNTLSALIPLDAQVVFFDGDAIVQSGATFYPRTEAETRTMDQVKALGAHNCFVLGAHGDRRLLDAVEKTFCQPGILGYLGRLNFPGYGLREFYEVTGTIALVLSANIQGQDFQNFNFGFLRDYELRALGFDPVEAA